MCGIIFKYKILSYIFFRNHILTLLHFFLLITTLLGKRTLGIFDGENDNKKVLSFLTAILTSHCTCKCRKARQIYTPPLPPRNLKWDAKAFEIPPWTPYTLYLLLSEGMLFCLRPQFVVSTHYYSRNKPNMSVGSAAPVLKAD